MTSSTSLPLGGWGVNSYQFKKKNCELFFFKTVIKTTLSDVAVSCINPPNRQAAISFSQPFFLKLTVFQ